MKTEQEFLEAIQNHTLSEDSRDKLLLIMWLALKRIEDPSLGVELRGRSYGDWELRQFARDAMAEVEKELRT